MSLVKSEILESILLQLIIINEIHHSFIAANRTSQKCR